MMNSEMSRLIKSCILWGASTVILSSTKIDNSKRTSFYDLVKVLYI